jgi:hypothetical protein
MPTPAQLPTFQLPEQAEAPAGGPPAPVGVVGAPPAAPAGPPPPAGPLPVAPAPTGGSGGASPWTDPDPVEIPASELTSDPSGAWRASDPLVGTVTLVAPDHVLSTIVLPAGSGVTALRPTPLHQAPPATGWATVQGNLAAPPDSDYLVSFRAPGLGAFHGQKVAADGSFSFQVPVAGALTGVVMAVDRSESPPLALARVSLSEGATTDPIALALSEPLSQAVDAPPPPAGMTPAASRLALLEGASRLDLAAFTLARVPRYHLPTFEVGAVFEAVAPGGLAGSDLVTGPGAAAPAFLEAPDLSAVATPLVPDTLLSWPAVTGARLYTLKLQRTGVLTPVWEGASPVSRIRLPAAMPTGLGDLELVVEAWDSAEVSTYSVAGLRALRIPGRPQSPGGRRSWALRRGLGS